MKPIPETYRELSYDQWLDIFLEYALFLAKENIQESYDLIHSAYDATPFGQRKDHSFMIYVCKFG